MPALVAVFVIFGLTSSIFAEDDEAAASPDKIPGLVTGEDEFDDADADDDSAEGRESQVLGASVGLQARYRNIVNRAYKLDTVARIGEKLTYLVKWKGIPAGTATLEVKRQAQIRGRPVYVVELHSVSNDFLSLVYDVDSTIRSFIDVEDGRSHLFRRNGKEGRRNLDDSFEFDYDRKREDGILEPASIYSKMKNGQLTTNLPRPIPGPLQDSLSIIYYMRKLDLNEKGIGHEVLVGSRKRTDIVTIKVLGFEQVTLPAKMGTFECIKVEPKGDPHADHTNIVVTKGTAVFWLEKNTRIPIMAQVDISVGSLTLYLVKAENTSLADFAIKKNDK